MNESMNQESINRWINLWFYESMNQWINESMNQWINELRIRMNEGMNK